MVLWRRDLTQARKLCIVKSVMSNLSPKHLPSRRDLFSVSRPCVEKGDGSFANKIHCGDCVTVLKNFPNESVDSVITSPPYFQQRDYTGIGTGMENHYVDYIDSLLEGLSEIVRIVKPSGSIIYNLGDKIDKHKGTLLIPYRFAIAALENESKLMLLNNITWEKKNPTPRQFNRRLVSSTEPFFHFVKSQSYHYAINDYMKEEKIVEHKMPSGKVGDTYFKGVELSDLSLAQKNYAKKEIKKVIDELKEGKVTGFRVKIRGLHSLPFGGMEGGRKTQLEKNGFTIIKLYGRPMKKDHVSYAVESIKGNRHPAVFPLPLIEEFIKLTCPHDGIVLDHYCGSGTTLLAAVRQGRKYIGIDINPQYCRMAEKRLQNE